jgi:predicted HicB family RNase H-like nuclease
MTNHKEGGILVRLDPTLKAAITSTAKARGISTNNLVSRILAKAFGVKHPNEGAAEFINHVEAA